VQLRQVDGCATVKLQGELDLMGRPRMDSILARVGSADARRVVFDLEGLTFVEGYALARWAELAQALRARGSELVLRAPPSNVERVLSLMHLEDQFAFEN
jgi:anti-anti-sigma factor